MHEWVSAHLAGVGDVIERGGQLAVVTRVAAEADGTGVILAVRADGAPQRWEWRPDRKTPLLNRLGHVADRRRKPCATSSRGTGPSWANTRPGSGRRRSDRPAGEVGARSAPAVCVAEGSPSPFLHQSVHAAFQA